RRSLRVHQRSVGPRDELWHSRVLPSQADFAETTVDLDQIDHRHRAAAVAPDQVQSVRTEPRYSSLRVEHESDEGIAAVLIVKGQEAGAIGFGTRIHQPTLRPG